MQWPGKKKLDKKSISEILVADTDSEPGSEGSNFEDYFEEEEEEEEEEGEEEEEEQQQKQQQQQQQASAEVET